MNSIVVSLFLVAAAVGCLGAPGPNCSPATIEEQPPSVKRICFELFKIFNPNAEQALMDEGYLPVLRDGIYDKVIRPDGPDYKVKRQDVDHVFLRFGRRR